MARHYLHWQNKKCPFAISIYITKMPCRYLHLQNKKCPFAISIYITKMPCRYLHLQNKNALSLSPFTEQKCPVTISIYRTKMSCCCLHLQNKNALSLPPFTEQTSHRYAVLWGFVSLWYPNLLLWKQTSVARFAIQLKDGNAIPLRRLQSNANEINKDVDRPVLIHS